MTDADTPRVPDFRWIHDHGLFRVDPDGKIYQLVDHNGEPFEEAVEWTSLFADAVKLGDVEAAEAKLADIRAVLAENYNPNLERWRFPGEVLDLIRAVLDREPGREEPFSGQSDGTPPSNPRGPDDERCPTCDHYVSGCDHCCGPEPAPAPPDRSGRWVAGDLQPFGPRDLDGWQPTYPEAVAGD
ncbi:hypothetical protein [Amycolatopsis sp. CFH S0078]|uniref:hypothetical protein n=1 Tax=Amycolatopsis sp. CFH S0078 TaxID=1644108 RepID=UPI00106ECA10|nr:hypothetical protein [Amycolatopsis sp. CFH S0078]